MTDSSQPSALTYLIVWVVLVVLATLSLLASHAPLGAWNVIVAFVIATIKAVLVLGFFMHLLHGPPLHRIVIAIAIGFVVLIVLGVLADVATRSVASVYVDDVGSLPSSP